MNYQEKLVAINKIKKEFNKQWAIINKRLALDEDYHPIVAELEQAFAIREAEIKMDEIMGEQRPSVLISWLKK